MEKGKLKVLFLLHLMLMIYSMSGICSKKAAGVPFLSPMFCVYYGLIILLLGFYAIGWQQVLKRIPLTTAYAHKSVTVIWGVVFGVLLFHETLNPRQIAGVILVICGIVLYSLSDKAAEHAAK